MKKEKPIKQPYESPENYFMVFNARVMQKIDAEKQLKSRFLFSRSSNYAYAAAVAAILIVLSLGLYKGMFTGKNQSKEIAESFKNRTQSDGVITKITATSEDEVIRQWVEAAEEKPAVAAIVLQKNREEHSVEQELEAEGLIVMDVETAWIDENEILP